MAIDFKTLTQVLDHSFDTLIDVRSPSEFAEDHIPGAINLPVLDDNERAEVGTIYVQKSPFLARKIGAAKVFRNAARHIETNLLERDGGWRPLVYCWRGGQRSGSFCWMLEQIGWRADTMRGGYRSYRRLVNDMLYSQQCPFRLILIDGNTGTAKTEVLRRLSDRGYQILDLEGLAKHRGSLLGGLSETQPSQKAFESGVAAALAGMTADRPVLVEAESSRIGARNIPPSLWKAMTTAMRIEITADLEARADYLVDTYSDILADEPRLRTQLAHLRTLRGHAIVDGWLSLAAAGDKRSLTRELVLQHYDPAYATSRRSGAETVAATVHTDSLDDRGLGRLVDAVEAAVSRVLQRGSISI